MITCNCGMLDLRDMLGIMVPYMGEVFYKGEGSRENSQIGLLIKDYISSQLIMESQLNLYMSYTVFLNYKFHNVHDI